ncbi:EAL domain-containing protein [Idiomarina sp. OXR-189]|uniref:bifunctional diguanylate cyclase/phosphodiesterase n=1 Tax=Idiomarina sp. OXR-189 TaxID=3100175 RepID=UPI002AC8D318|nr:EAL domain-containing protein [Idiomarina sp. OXR-189]WPZ02533.1 EAL domain-containing protein [Idiomarina sp. OXR-189]
MDKKVTKVSNTNHHQDVQSILELYSQRTEVGLLLNAVIQWLENEIEGSIASIMVADKHNNELRMLGSKSFSNHFISNMQKLEIKHGNGTCGSAACLKSLVITENIENDTTWRPYWNLAKSEGLEACWSYPIIDANGVFYGTFATYYRQPRSPEAEEIELIKRLSQLTAVIFSFHTERSNYQLLSSRFGSLFTQHPDAIFEIDTEGYFLLANQSTLKIAGVSENEMRGTHFNELVVESHRDKAADAFRKTLSGLTSNYEICVVNSDNELFWLDVTNTPVISGKTITGVFGIGRDITAKKEQEKQLQLLRKAINDSPYGIVMNEANSPNMPITYVNNTFCEMTGYSEDEALGQNSCSFLQGPDTNTDVLQTLRSALENKQEASATLRHYRKDGTWFWDELFISPVFNNEEQCTHFICFKRDVSKERQAQDYIANYRRLDALTGLLSRSSFDHQLALEATRFNKDEFKLTVLYIDIDDFSSMNESLGHNSADILLKAIADRLKHLTSSSDTLARVAADEFILLRVHNQSTEEVDAFVKLILTKLEEPYHIESNSIRISASIGVSECLSKQPYHERLVSYASSARLEAKQQGGNTWSWFNQTGSSLLESEYATIRFELREAIDQEQLRVFYQPIVRTQDESIAKVEALIRWEHPKKGMVPPGHFIPLAEKTGQIIPIGEWVLSKACKDIAIINKKSEKNYGVTVNISPLQFRREGFIQQLRAALKASKLAPDLLTLEVTESVLVMGADRTIDILNQIKSMGVKIAIDDFGTGYSSLSYLRDLPVDTLKLDQSFIKGLPDNTQDAAIVEGVIKIVHQLGIDIVAEGIESVQQANFLKKLNCDYLQGFYYAKPSAIDELFIN